MDSPGTVAEVVTWTNTLLVVFIGFLLYKIFGPRFQKGILPPFHHHFLLLYHFIAREDEEPKLPDPLPKHDMTLEELVKYDGNGPDKRVCIAVLGRVYDVSKSECLAFLTFC